MTDSDKSKEQKALTEIPESLKRLTLILAKTFYGLEHYVICEQVQRRVIVREEELRDLCKIDQRQLRKFLVSLKVDKLIKERQVPEEVDGKLRKFNYLFVNYKAVLNVAKYKIDHIRQKLEVREKDDVHRAYYRCTGCKKQYDAMDVGQIYDPFTQEMKCWQCKCAVEPDESGGPSNVTRSSMAKFNDQMTGIFSLIKQMDGVRFAPQLIEPVIQSAAPKTEGETIDLDARTVINLGQRAFSRAAATRSNLYGAGITVSIGDNDEGATIVQKAEIPWLQQRNQHTMEAQTSEPISAATQADRMDSNLAGDIGGLESTDEATRLSTSEADSAEPVPKRLKREEIANLLQMERESEIVEKENGATEENFGDGQRGEDNSTPLVDTVTTEDENSYVLVQGECVHVDQIDETMLARMSEQEKSDYYERMQGDTYAEFY